MAKLIKIPNPDPPPPEFSLELSRTEVQALNAVISAISGRGNYGDPTNPRPILNQIYSTLLNAGVGSGPFTTLGLKIGQR